MATPTSSSSFKLTGHTNDINSIACHPFLPIVASGSDDGTVRLWDLETRRCVRTLEGHTESVDAVAFDPTGRHVASGSCDDTVKLWDLDSTKGCPVHTFRDRAMLSVRAAAWNPWGTLVASGSTDHCVRVWDAASGTLLHTLEEHFGWVEAVVSHPVGDLFASASEDTTVRVWRWSTGESVHTLEGHTGWVTSLAASASFVVSGSMDKTVRVWSWTSGLCARVIDGFAAQLHLNSLAWRGLTLIVLEETGTMHVWDTSSDDEDPPTRWSCARSLPSKISFWCGVSMTHGGQIACAAKNDTKTIVVWERVTDF